MPGVLDEILANKRIEVERALKNRSIESLCSMPAFAAPPRNFYGAVSAPRRNGPNLIAEIKRASPSAGTIVADFDPTGIARRYSAGGARALSVLTDEKYFGGRLEYVEQVREAVGLPVLRKDFLIDPYQVYESRAFGADAILLIAEALEPALLAELLTVARELSLCVLLEVHTRRALLRVLQNVPATQREGVLLGINNRDLTTQRVDLSTTERVIDLVPPGMPVVAESGIKSRADVERMYAVGARALLVGEALMRHADPETTIQTMFNLSPADRA